jgi:hypothetical protein
MTTIPRRQQTEDAWREGTRNRLIGEGIPGASIDAWIRTLEGPFAKAHDAAWWGWVGDHIASEYAKGVHPPA